MDDVYDTSVADQEVGTLHENVQEFVQISEQLAEDKTLTPELALESIPVLGHNGLLDAYYSVGSKTKRYQIATESVAQRLNELYVKAYNLLKSVIKRCIAWVKSLFGGKKNAKETKEEIRQASNGARLVVTAAQEAQDLREPKTFKEVVTSHKLDTEFLRGLTPTENDIFIDGPYMKSLHEVVQELEHGHALTELSTQLTALGEWFQKVVAEATKKDAAEQPLGAEQTGMYYDDKSKDLVNGNRESTDLLLKKLWAARDAKEGLPDYTGSEKVYDLVGMSNELERVVTRISMNDTGPLLDRWNGVLESVQAQLDAGMKAAQALAEEADQEESEGYHGKNRQTLSAQYLNALGTFGSRINQLQSAVMMIQAYMFTDSFNLYYKIVSFLNKAAAAFQHEQPSEETHRLFQMTKDVLAKRHE